MDAFLGKWKQIPSSIKGFDEFADAMKMSDQVRQQMSGNKGVTTEIRQEGDKYVISTDRGTHQEINSHKLGEWATITAYGKEIKHLIKLEGLTLVGEHEVMGQTTSSRRWVEGDKLNFEVTGNGKTMKSVLQKM